jgi:uncharacterized protein YlxW (UPF0749 family)
MNKEMMLQAELNRKLVELKNAKAKIDKLNKEIEMYKEQINAYEMDDKDHVKAEISATKKRIIELGGEDIEEVFTDPLKSEAQKEQDKVNDMYTTKGI